MEFNKKQKELIIKLFSERFDNDTQSPHYIEAMNIINIVKKDFLDNKAIVEKFLNKYSYIEDVFFDEELQEYVVGVNICNEEYCCHWKQENMDRIYLNNFLVDYKTIMNIKELDVLKTESEYKERYSNLNKRLNDIGVTFKEDCICEYEALLIYSMPIEKLLDEDFINEFTKIIKDYNKEFEAELAMINKKGLI